MSSKVAELELEREKPTILTAYQKHFAGLKKMVSGLLQSQDDVEDVLQDAFLKAYAIEKSERIEQPKAYLYQATRNAAFSRMRQQSRRPTDYIEELDAIPALENAVSPEDECLAMESLHHYFEAIASLPFKCRSVFLMRKAHGMSYNEIARRLRISPKTVENHLLKAMARCSEYQVNEESKSRKNAQRQKVASHA